MVAVNPPSKILVTGASGFIAIHVVRDLIAKGYLVRGTVRSVAKGEYLSGLFGDKYETAIVEDMEVPGAYDQAVQGVDAVIHPASIVKPVFGHPDEIIKPAIGGTIGVLESALAYGSSVKRVIITSSMAAVGNTAVDSDWNQAAVDAVNERGINTHPIQKYAASKVLAERAAWVFVEKNKSAMSFDVVTLCPPKVFGPMIHEGTDPNSINYSVLAMVTELYQSPTPPQEELEARSWAFIDVRDLADLHTSVLSAEKAGNERFVAVTGVTTLQEMLDYLNESPRFSGTPKGHPSATKYKEVRPKSSEKLSTVLERRPEELFRPLRETIRDTVTSCTERGWTPPETTSFHILMERYKS